LINRGELEGRFDSIYYTGIIKKLLKNSIHKIKTIKTIIEYMQTGFASGQHDQAKDEKGIVQIRPTNLDNNGLLKFDKNIYIPSFLIEEKKNNLLLKDEVLFNNTNSQELVGKTTYFDLEGSYFCSNHITRIKTNELIKSKYLWILLNLYQKYKVFFNSCTNWNNQSGINNKLLKSYKIPVPSLTIQQNIIDIMENAYKVKKQKEQESKKLLDGIDEYLLDELGIILPNEPDNSIENRTFKVGFDDLFNSRFDCDYYSRYYRNLKRNLNNGFYEIIKLANISKYIFQGIGQNLTDNNNNILLKVKNVLQNNEIDFINTEYISEIPTNKVLKENDIITPFIGEAIKKYKLSVFRSPDKDLNYCVDNNTGVIRLDINKANASFVASFFISNIGKQLIKQLIGGGGVPFLGANNAKKLILPLPPINIQNEISTEINQRRKEAKQLQNEAKEILEKAKKEVENIILGEDNGKS
jgi:restriction endonuclease S subunit